GSPVLDVAQSVAKGMGSVASPVVGQDLANGDASTGEPGVGADPEISGGLFAFIGQQLAVDQPGVAVDRGVQIVVADHRVPRRAAAAGVGGGIAATGAAAEAQNAAPSFC